MIETYSYVLTLRDHLTCPLLSVLFGRKNNVVQPIHFVLPLLIEMAFGVFLNRIELSRNLRIQGIKQITEA